MTDEQLNLLKEKVWWLPSKLTIDDLDTLHALIESEQKRSIFHAQPKQIQAAIDYMQWEATWMQNKKVADENTDWHEIIEYYNLAILALESYQPKPTSDIQDFGLHSSSINHTVTIDNQEDAEKLVDALDESALSQSPQTDGWISVKDRLPDTNMPVVMMNVKRWFSSDFDFNYSKVGYRFFFNGVTGWAIFGERAQELDTFTHWMPLPEPPKGE